LSKLIFDKFDNEIFVKNFVFDNKEKIQKNSTSHKQFKILEDLYKERSKRCRESIKNDDVNLLANSRIAIKDGMQMSEIFNPINYYILKEYSKEFKNNSIMLNILSSTLHLCRLTDLKSQSQFPYWVPKTNVVERNVLLVLKKRIYEILKNKKFNSPNLKMVKEFSELKNEKKGVLILNKPSQFITDIDIPNGSVDIVITDPPYFDQVAYSEYLKIWENFCYFESNLDHEIIQSNRKQSPSTEQQYLDNLTRCFSLVSQKLKANGLAIIFFKDSKPSNIHLFLEAMELSNLSFVRSVHVGNKKFTYKQNTTQETTVGGECLFFFTKCSLNKEGMKTYNHQERDEQKIFTPKISDVVCEFANEYLKLNEKASLGELYDNGLLLNLYKNGLLRGIKNSKAIVDILNSKFMLDSQRNYRIK
jgi:DNA methylase